MFFRLSTQNSPDKLRKQIAFFITSALILPFTLGKGMFFDGLTYAAIARNLAENKGSFLHPFYCLEVKNPFYEHPPLAFGIQSLAFKIFGSSYLIEKLYSVLCMLLLLAVFKKIISRLSEENSNTSFYNTLLFYMPIPVVYWSWTSNLLENTLMVFMFASIFFILTGLQKRKNGYFILSAIFIFAAWHVKGPVSLSVLAIPALYYIVFKTISLKETIKAYLIIGLILAASAILLAILVPEWKWTQTEYLQTQVLASLQNKREITGNSHFFILIELLQQSIYPLLLFLLTLLFSRQIKVSKTALFALLYSICCIVPVMISLKQRIFYIAPAFPFLALFLAELSKEGLGELFKKMNRITQIKYLLPSLWVLLLMVCIYIFGKPIKDKEYVHLSEKAATLFQEYGAVNVSSELENDWRLHAYLMRFSKTSIATQDSQKYKIVLKGQEIPGASLVFSTEKFLVIAP